MKALVVAQYFWPENFRINDVAKTLLEKGIEIEMLTGKPNYPRGEEIRYFDGLLNTLFNENEPVVCRPEEALDYFLHSKMDVLVQGNWIVRRTESA